jgi:hypothetical protein
MNNNRAYAKRWRRKNRLKVRAYAAKWREDHRQHVRDTHQAWRNAHPDLWKAAVKRNRKAHPETVNARHRRYRRRQKENVAKLLATLPCFDCGVKHTPARRAEVIRRMLPATAKEIREARPCFWGDASDVDCPGVRMLYRDLKQLAVRVGGTFYPPAEARAAA